MKKIRGFQPFDKKGNRTYLTICERDAFLHVARNADPKIASFCLVLTYTGARISEVLALTSNSIDVQAQCIVIESLKKRTNGIYRAVPVPRDLLSILEETHSLTGLKHHRLWPWCRTTAWSRVAWTMALAGVTGSHANARGLRHTFAVSAIQGGVPLNMVQKWMGHSDIETTALYANAVGQEELSIAGRYWTSFSPDGARDFKL